MVRDEIAAASTVTCRRQTLHAFYYSRRSELLTVPSGVDDARGVVAQADDGDLYQLQVVLEEPLLLLLLLLHQEVDLEFLKASPSGVDERHRSDLCGKDFQKQDIVSRLWTFCH